MRNISFHLTSRQVERQEKDISRRMGWVHLQPGTMLQPVVKGQGLKKGEKVEKIGGPIRVVSVRRERLDRLLTEPEYGQAEMLREGFPRMTPAEFVTMFKQANPTCLDNTIITRIEFAYGNAIGVIGPPESTTPAASEELARQRASVVSFVPKLAGARSAPPARTADEERYGTPEEVASVKVMVDQMRPIFKDQPFSLIMAALQEMTGRVVSACVDDPAVLEQALDIHNRNVRGWWCADRGGPFLES